MRKEWQLASTLLFSIFLLAATFAAEAEDIISHPAESSVIVDGASADWSSVEGHVLVGRNGTLKVSHGADRLYLLLQLTNPEDAYLALCKGLSVWIDSGPGHSKKCGLKYAGSKKMAVVLEESFKPVTRSDPKDDGERMEPPDFGEGPRPEHSPVGGERPPGPPSGGPHGGSRDKAGEKTDGDLPPPGKNGNDGGAGMIFKKTIDPGIVLVSQGQKSSMQIECLRDSFCAMSSIENNIYCYEFSISWNELKSAAIPPVEDGASIRINIGLDLPELLPNQEIVETQAPSMQMDGAGGPGGGMGGGPGGGMGGGPGGGMGGGPGGGMGGSPGGGMGPGGPGKKPTRKEGPSYTVTTRTQWFSVVVGHAPIGEIDTLHSAGQQ